MSSRCTLRIDFAAYVREQVLIVTLVNAEMSAFALNWALGLRAIGLRGVVGVSARLNATAETTLQDAGAGVFCTSSEEMQINAQAGRWAEVASLLQSGFSVLLSDVDVGWARDPLPYLRRVLQIHPAVGLLLSSNRARDPLFTRAPLRGSGRRDGWLELEEPAPFVTDNTSSALNVGIAFFSHAAQRGLEAMLKGWVAALTMPSQRSAHGEPQPPRKKLVAFDQGVIVRTLHRRMRMCRHPTDKRLALVDPSPPGGQGRGPVAPLAFGLGVLPSLQFSTAHVHSVWRPVRAPGAEAPPPFAVHAIIALGRTPIRKQWVLREAGLWRLDDAPRAQVLGADDGRANPADSVVAKRLLQLETPAWPASLLGYDRITTQLRQVL